MNKKVPVLVLAFNRPDYVVEALKTIKEYKPDKLYLACDGPRAHVEGEKEVVKRTQKVMLDAVNWSCEVKTLFREENLGCTNAVYEAISWFFEHEEYGIICEDDVLISIDFFKLCEDLLPRYKDNDKIMQITSQYYGKHNEYTNEYTFERKSFIWGWATWRRSWSKYMDMSMSNWKSYNPLRLIPVYGLFQTIMMCYYWSDYYRKLKKDISWDSRWHMAAVTNELLCVCPKTNLAVNIGCASGGAHFLQNDVDPYTHLKVGHLTFPLIHPKDIKLDIAQVAIDNKDFLRLRKIGLKKKFKRILNRIRVLML